MKETQALAALAALSQETRLRIFRRLVRSEAPGQPAGQIAEALEIPPPTLSFHLKELLRAGLVVDRREGRSIIYSLNVAAVRSLLGFLLEDCCQGRPELCQVPSSAEVHGDACCAKPRRHRQPRRASTNNS
jgi:DNA-binding transcriptional ArsR family regulator